MARVRPYVAGDWGAVLDICLAFAPACESLERSLGPDLDWTKPVGKYSRSLTRSGARGRLLVAEQRGSVVGFVGVRFFLGPRMGRGPQVVEGMVRPARFERATYRFVARGDESANHHQDDPSTTKDGESDETDDEG